ncbi:MAG: LytTR family DNA-binding domain-containing protein [Eubacteriales bacterium]|nr:LytTR family DNA-binding domain-containing protein [Eubacteriales bacterium]
MIKVAILDDEDIYLQKEREISEQYFLKKGIECRVETFQNPDWFLMGSGEEAYDIYILDVEMPGKTGLEVARAIRRRYPDSAVLFVTNYIEYAVEGYEVNAYRYIPKQVLREKLIQAYDMLLPGILSREEQYYIIAKRGNMEKIWYADLYYLYKDGKYVVLCHRRGESRVRKTLIELHKELNDREFLMVDKSYVVNIKHVMKIEGHDIYMRNGMKIPVGRPRLGEIQKAVMDYWLKGKK